MATRQQGSLLKTILLNIPLPLDFVNEILGGISNLAQDKNSPQQRNGC